MNSLHFQRGFLALMQVLLSILLVATPLLGSTTIIHDERLSQELGFAWFCDKDISNLEDFKGIPNYKKSSDRLSLGYMPEANCFVLFELLNLTDKSLIFYLEHQHPLTSWLELQQNGLQIERLGFYEENSRDREVDFAHPTFRITINPGVSSYVIKIRSDDLMLLNFHLWPEKEFSTYRQKYYAFHGGYFVLCMALSVYNIMQFFVTGRRSFVYYILYLIFSCATHLFVTGILKQTIMTSSSPFDRLFGFVLAQANIFATIAFVNSFLRISRRFPKTAKFTWLMAIPISMTFLSIAQQDFTKTGYWNVNTYGALCLFILVMGIRASIVRDRNAYYFILGWSLPLCGVLIYIGVLYGIFPPYFLIRNAHIIGAGLESIVFSFALADQVKQAQIRAVQQKKHAFSQLKKMVYPHQLSQIKLGADLEDTMPCQGTTAVVICFDIVNSSKIIHPQAKEFFSRVFKKCHELMEKDYQFRPLSAYGYRLKELGDGFLCSVGFPFATPQDMKAESLAVELAQGFIRVFELEARSIKFDKSLQASIGIARGYVEGYFTVSGTLHYELFGPGVVLATRYENIRKSLDIIGNDHLIVLQSSVYELLPPEQKKQFSQYSLGDTRFRIRNDQNAQYFYYQRFKAANQNSNRWGVA